RHRSLDSVFAAAEQFPLQQFYLMPWLWEFVAQHRREVVTGRSRLAWLYRWYFFLVFAVMFHVVLLSLVRWGRRGLIHSFYRRIMHRAVVKRWKVVDTSQ